MIKNLMDRQEITPEIICQNALSIKPKALLVVAIDQENNPIMFSTPMALPEMTFINGFIECNIQKLFRDGLVINQEEIGRKT